MKLLVATNNYGKYIEFKEMLKNQFDEILYLKDLSEEIVVEETGITFQQNAKKKAIEVAKKTGMITLGDDSGIVVDALCGTPGVYSARYSKKGDDESNNAKLMSKMQGIPKEKRTARFVCALALCNPNNMEVIEVTGTVEGEIAKTLVGIEGFGYDPLFYYPQLGLTFGQMTEEEKNSISHRRNALTELLEVLKSNNVKQTSFWD